MAKHERQILREAVVARLTNATAAQHRVEAMRFVSYRGLELPAIGVYISEEPIDTSSSTAPRKLTRTPQLAIEGVVRYAYDKVENDLDALALEIEKAIDPDPTFGTLCDAILSSTSLDVLIDGDTMVGVVRLTYAVTYETDAPRPADVTLDALKTVDAKTSLGGAQAAADRSEVKVENLDT